MTDEQEPLPLKPIFAGILCAQFVAGVALTIYMAFNPTRDQIGTPPIDLVAWTIGPALLMTIPVGVPLMLLARRNLRDPGLGRRDWAGTGLYAGFIGGGLGGLILIGWSLTSGQFEAIALLIGAGFIFTGMILGGAIGLIARPISRYFASNAA